MCNDLNINFQYCKICKNRRQDLSTCVIFPKDELREYKKINCKEFDFDENEFTRLQNIIYDEMKLINTRTFEKKSFFDESNRIEYEVVKVSFNYLYRNMENIPLEFEIKRGVFGKILGYSFFIGIAIWILYLSIFRSYENKIFWIILGTCLSFFLIYILISREKNILKCIKINTTGITFYGKEFKSIDWKDVLTINILMEHVLSKVGLSVHRTIIIHLITNERISFPAIELLNLGSKAKELLYWARFYQNYYWRKKLYNSD